MAVAVGGAVAADNDTVIEDVDEGMDTVHYTAPPDNETTTDADESENGVTVTKTPQYVEVLTGTQNGDTITAHADGATILGLEGDDTLSGATGVGVVGVDTLVGCTGENTLRGGGGSDVFGVFSDETNADTIMDFTTGMGTATTDEIHLKGFEAGAVATVGLIPGDATHAGVLVDGVLVAIVASDDIGPVKADPRADPPVVGKTKVEAIRDALGKGDAVVFDHEFDPAKCSSD